MTADDPATCADRHTRYAVLEPRARLARDVTAWPAAGQDRDFRLSRVRRLRQMLAAGTYFITPEQVALKMIGRGICDQVAHLVDA